MSDQFNEISDEMTLNQFRDEMQHRVVKYGSRSRAVKEAVRFARRQKDPEFYRVAMDKVHAQEQYRREVEGPSRWERIMDFLNMGSLREVIVVLMLVGVTCASIEMFRGSSRGSDAQAAVDIDRLASRLGFDLDAPAVQVRQAAAGHALPASAAKPNTKVPPAASSATRAAGPAAETALEERLAARLEKTLAASSVKREAVQAAVQELLLSDEFVGRLATAIQGRLKQESK